MSFLSLSRPSARRVPAERVHGEYLRRQTGVLIATCFSYIGYYIIRLIFTTEQVPIRKAYGFSIAQIGLILSTFGIGYGIAKLVMGSIADRVNSKSFLAFGLYVSALLNAILAFSRNFWVILVLMLLISVTQAIGAPACHREINLWFSKKRRGTVFAVWSSAHNAGAFFCVACVEIATAWFSGSLVAVFLTASVISAVIATVMLLINSDRPEACGLPNIDEYSRTVELDAKGESRTVATTDKTVWQVFVQDILKNKVVWAISLASMSFYIVRYGVLSWIPSYLPTKGFTVGQAKWLVGIFELAAVPAVILLGFISDAVKSRRALVCFCCTILMIVALAIYFTSSSKTIIWIVLFVLGGTIYAPLALVDLMVNEAAPKYACGLSTGFMGFFQYVFGETLATALIGELVSSFGWGACDKVLYTAAGLCLVLTAYLIYHERSVVAMEHRLNEETKSA